jgi:hypothetical protein
MSAPTTPSPVDRENPWPGLVPFTEAQHALFFGRDSEAQELVQRVERKLITVLFGQSGLGKSSLLQAGVFPRLRSAGYLPVYFRLDHNLSAAPPAEQLKALIARATAEAGTWTRPGSATAGETLWEFFHHRDDRLCAADGKFLTPVLVLDQFEELFTLGAAGDETRARVQGFLAEMADLVENRPPAAFEARLEAGTADVEAFDFTRSDYRILLSLREDYLPHLEGLKAAMPSVMQNRQRLTRLTGSQALDAVSMPAPGLVTAEVARAIVAFVSGRSDPDLAEVEPALLSLVCRELNIRRIVTGAPVIEAGLLEGSRSTILVEFYERTLSDQPPAVRAFVEDELLTESGHRENVALERAQRRLAAAGADPGALDALVDRRLLHIEERLDVRRVELTHDVLCGVVRASRDARHGREREAAAERQLRGANRALWRARWAAALLVGLFVAVWLDLHSMSERALRRQAQDLNAVITGVRGYYSKNVVSRILASPGTTRVVHNYAEIPGAIPIPATLSLELGRVVSENQSNIAYRFVSDFPFKGRAPHSLDEFETGALRSRRENPKQELVSVKRTMLSDQVRLITPVIMTEGCVKCHNSHPDSPKRDWKVGDVRGIQEVVVNQPIAKNLMGFRFLTIYAMFAGAFGFVLIGVQRHQASSEQAGTVPPRAPRRRDS